MEISEVIANFKTEGNFLKYNKLTSGNINKTYLVINSANCGQIKYILQKINGYVFKNPQRLMKNVIDVTNHIRRKIHTRDKNRQVIEFISAKNDLPYFIDNNGEFWRVYKYIDNSVTFDETDDISVVEETGKAYGKFQLFLSDFNAENLFDTIEDFHDTEKRFHSFFDSVKKNLANRKKLVEKQIEYLKSKSEYASFFTSRLKEGKIQLKVTHNDTKCNNVLFDKVSKKALTVIDLDTVMRGLVAYDFGDGSRSICSTAKEDETDYDKIDFDLNKFRAFTKGFLSKTVNALSEEELNTLYIAPYIMTLELASRFLKDYLDGDLYFNCLYENQNLDRANNQIILSQKIERKLIEIKDIVDKCACK